MDKAAIDIISTDQALEFQKFGYCVIRQAVNKDVINVLENYARMQRFNNYYLHDEGTNSQWRYADAFGESMLLHLQTLMEKTSGKELYPTNSVLRIYQNGGVLKKHTDRATCEYSATLTVGYDAKDIYPIWIAGKNGAIEVKLDRGDMLVYKGCDIPHWRETFQGRNWIQLFLHYVDVNGEYAQYKNDGRIMIGMNSGKVLAGKQAK